MNRMEAKKQVLSFSQRCYKEALIAGTNGNLSALTDDGLMAITPSGKDYLSMSVDEIMLIDLEGQIIEGPHKPSSEWRMHAEIYKNLPETKAIVHTHSPYATSFAVIHEPIPTILIEMLPFLNGDVQVASYAQPGTAMVGLNAVEKLRDRRACLMANHGVISVGASLAQAHVRAVYVEDAAKICHMARCIGKPIVMSDEDLEKMRQS